MDWSSIVTIVSFFIGVIGLYLAFKSYKRKKVSVTNVFSESSANLVLGNIGNLKVVYKDVSYENISAHEFIIFNDGSEGIDNEDVVTDHPLKFYVSEESNILDFSVVSETSEIIESQVVRKSNKEILVNFVWLEKKHGIRLKILTDTVDLPKVSGKIKKHEPFHSVSKIKSVNLVSLVADRFFTIKSWIKELLQIFTVVFLFVLAIVTYAKYEDYSKQGDAYILLNEGSLIDAGSAGKTKYRYMSFFDDYNVEIKLYSFGIDDLVNHYQGFGYKVELVPSDDYLEPKIFSQSRIEKMVVNDSTVEIRLVDNIEDLVGVLLSFSFSLVKVIIYLSSAFLLVLFLLLVFHYKSIINISKYYPLLNSDEKKAIKIVLRDSLVYRFIVRFVNPL